MMGQVTQSHLAKSHFDRVNVRVQPLYLPDPSYPLHYHTALDVEKKTFTVHPLHSHIRLFFFCNLFPVFVSHQTLGKLSIVKWQGKKCCAQESKKKHTHTEQQSSNKENQPPKIETANKSAVHQLTDLSPAFFFAHFFCSLLQYTGMGCQFPASKKVFRATQWTIADKSNSSNTKKNASKRTNLKTITDSFVDTRRTGKPCALDERLPPYAFGGGFGFEVIKRSGGYRTISRVA